jgi:hypothetical protein
MFWVGLPRRARLRDVVAIGKINARQLFFVRDEQQLAERLGFYCCV